MPWARFDDRFPWHRKIRRLPDAAFRLHVSAVCWCNEHGTDGVVKTDELVLVSDVKKPTPAVAALVAAGVWDLHPEGWEIHDFLKYNPSAAQVRKEREAAADRQRRAREAAQQKRLSQGESRRDSAVTSPGVTVPPTRPDPTRPVLVVERDEEVPEVEVDPVLAEPVVVMSTSELPETSHNTTDVDGIPVVDGLDPDVVVSIFRKLGAA